MLARVRAEGDVAREAVQDARRVNAIGDAIIPLGKRGVA